MGAPSDLVTRGDVELDPATRVGRGCVLGGPGSTAFVGADCRLGDFVRVHAGVRLGPAGRVDRHAILGHPAKEAVAGRDAAVRSERVRNFLQPPGVEIRRGAVIRSHSVIYDRVSVGERLVTGHYALIREHTVVGDRCVFGTHASCDGFSRLGHDVHVGQYAQLSQAVTVGDRVFIGGHTVFSDNPMAIRDVSEDLVGAVLEDDVRVGLNCVILPGVRIGEAAMIGAGSTVTRDVPGGWLALGSPCRPVRELRDDEIESYRRSIVVPQ